MIVSEREGMASLIHDTNPTLRHSLQQSQNKGLYYGFRDAILSRLKTCTNVYAWYIWATVDQSQHEVKTITIQVREEARLRRRRERRAAESSEERETRD